MFTKSITRDASEAPRVLELGRGRLVGRKAFQLTYVEEATTTLPTMHTQYVISEDGVLLFVVLRHDIK